LDAGIRECEYWEMTIAEVIRAVESFNRVKKAEAQQKVSFDYVLAGLINRGIGITLGSKQSFPSLEEAYSSLFKDMKKEEEQKMQEQRNNVSALRFLQFSQTHNSRYNKGGAKVDK
jgi:hypothetical protein